jgi:hypothetical protein
VARAKKTARAEARRRYRAEQATGAEPIDADDGSPAGRTEPSRTTSPPPPAATGRVGIGTAFRLAFRPLDIRGDLRALPDIAIHSKALWLPLLITVASTAAIAAIGTANVVLAFMYAYFVQAPAIGGVFLGGFLAPRASWLVGLIVGLASVVCYSILILYFPLSLYARPPSEAEATQAIVAALTLSPTMGLMFAAAAAWYRRFLQYTNPNRGRQAAQPRRGDGRSRSSGTQKAGARR